MKNNRYNWALLMVSLAIIFTISCKKDPVPKNESMPEGAKTWYLKTMSGASTSLTSSGDAQQQIKQQVNWDAAVLYTLEDGTSLMGIPMLISNIKGNELKGDYMLLITRKGNEYQSVVAFNEKNDYFKSKFSNETMEQVYQKAVKVANMHKKATSPFSSVKGNGKVMLMNPDSPTCTDWYWTVYAIDSDGNFLYVISETYLYTTCSEGGNDSPNDPLPPEEEPVLDWGVPVSLAEGIETERTETVELDTFKVAKLSWVFHSGLTYRCISVERGVVKIKNGIKTFHSLVHESATKEGFVPYGTVKLFDVTSRVSVEPSNALINIKYRLRMTVNIPNFNEEYDSEPFGSYALWDTNFSKLN